MNKFYTKALGRFTTGDLDWVNNRIFCSLLFSSASYDDQHEYFSDIDSSWIASTIIVENKNVDLEGTMFSDDFVFPSVPENTEQVASIILWREVDDINNSPLIAWIDQAGAELPITPDGSDIPVTQDPSGLLKLVNP